MFLNTTFIDSPSPQRRYSAIPVWSSVPAVAQRCATPISATYAFLNWRRQGELETLLRRMRESNLRLAVQDFANHGGMLEALLQEDRQHLGRQFGRTGDQQPAAGLRIGEQRALDVAEALGIKHDVLTVAEQLRAEAPVMQPSPA